MNKFNLSIDTDTINMENEIHINNFSQKIKNLAQHCINYILRIEDKSDCSNNKFLPEFHDDDNDSTIGSCYVPLFTTQKFKIDNDIYSAKFPPLMDS